MNRIVLIIAATSALCAVSAQRLTDADIEMMIKCGRGEVKCQKPILWPGGLGIRMLDFEIEVLPPLGRVFLAAQDARSKYLKFGRDDVTPEMIAPTIEIRARNTDGDMKRNVNVEHIVVLPRGSKEGAVQPIKQEDWNFEAKNLMGASFTRIGKAAYFDPANLPPGELDIVIISDQYGEVRAGIDKKTRAKLDEWCGLKPVSR